MSDNQLICPGEVFGGRAAILAVPLGCIQTEKIVINPKPSPAMWSLLAEDLECSKVQRVSPLEYQLIWNLCSCHGCMQIGHMHWANSAMKWCNVPHVERSSFHMRGRLEKRCRRLISLTISAKSGSSSMCRVGLVSTAPFWQSRLEYTLKAPQQVSQGARRSCLCIAVKMFLP